MAAKPMFQPRKQPRQSRSKRTVEAILQAATQLWSAGGYAAGSTNEIAAKAGVSIGSLYEYFPNKESILVALVEQKLTDQIQQVVGVLQQAKLETHSLHTVLKHFVVAMLELHRDDPALHRALFEEAPHPAEFHACVLRAEEKLAHALEALLCSSAEVVFVDTDTPAHFIVQTVEALTHHFALHGLHQMETELFIQQVSCMLDRYLGISDSEVE